MIKRIVFILTLLSMVILSLTSCNKEDSSKQDLTLSQIEKDSLSYYKVHINEDSDIQIFSLINNNIIYKEFEKNDESIKYYKYDIENDNIEEIGTIDKPFIYSSSTAYLDDKLYFYMNTYNDDTSQEIETSLYEIDIKNSTINKLTSEQLDQLLVYVDVLDDKLLSFKGKIEGSQVKTYIEITDISSLSQADENPPIILSEYNIDDSSGEMIHNFSISEEFIYTLTSQIENDYEEYSIRQYDINGNIIRTVILDEEITKLLGSEMIGEFKVIHDYAFIRNFSGGGVLCDITQEVAQVKILSESDLDIAFMINSNESEDHTLLFQREAGLLWLLDAKVDMLYELDTNFHKEYEYFNYAILDNDKVILILREIFENEKELFYIDIEDIPIKQEYPLNDMEFKLNI